MDQINDEYGAASINLLLFIVFILVYTIIYTWLVFIVLVSSLHVWCNIYLFAYSGPSLSVMHQFIDDTYLALLLK